MNSSILDELRTLDGATPRSGTQAAGDAALREYGIHLPEAHIELLRITNGIDVYGGYTPLYGVGPNEGIDVINWNAHDCWKFA